MGLGLKEAKDFVEAGGKPIREGLTRLEADAVASRFLEIGAEVAVRT